MCDHCVASRSVWIVYFFCFGLYSVPVSAESSRFNPQISLTLDGRVGDYSNRSDYELPGFFLGGEATRGEPGFHLGHTELSLGANVDDLYTGKLTVAIAEHEGETETEIEEALIETIGLGHGLTVKAGRFFSDLGYLNNQHAHAQDFTDTPLIYTGLFGNQFIDDGLHLSWTAPTDLYFKIGTEFTRGDRFPVGGAANDGKAVTTLFTKTGGDIGVSQSWQLGLSYQDYRVNARTSAAHAHEDSTEIPSFTGNSEVIGIDLVWKWAENGNPRNRNLKIQFEYFQREEDGDVTLIGSSPPEHSTYQGKQSGWYLQSVYQFIPRWRIGFRYDRLSANNTGSDLDVLNEAGLSDEGHAPQRKTLMLDYSYSEYSRWRLQLADDEAYEDADTVYFLQYIMTLGAHGAHRF